MKTETEVKVFEYDACDPCDSDGDCDGIMDGLWRALNEVKADNAQHTIHTSGAGILFLHQTMTSAQYHDPSQWIQAIREESANEKAIRCLLMSGMTVFGFKIKFTPVENPSAAPEIYVVDLYGETVAKVVADGEW